MSRELAKQQIANYLRGKQGIKGVELASDPNVVYALAQENESFHDVTEELVLENKVVEIEYSVPSIPYRLKSFFLPEGSVVHRIRGQKAE